MTKSQKEDYYIQEAIKQAQESVNAGGFPAGSVIIKDGEIISVGQSLGNSYNDPTLHGEVDAIRKACNKLETVGLHGCTMYSSLQPCLMCFSACFWAGIHKIVYACAKSRVSQEYYVGDYDLTQIIQKSRIPSMELIHHKENEEQALKVVEDWENTNKK